MATKTRKHETTINAETAERAEQGFLGGFREFCVECRVVTLSWLHL